MKTNPMLNVVLRAFALLTILTACEDENEEFLLAPPTSNPVEYPTYILNEGSWGGNNANLSAFYPSNNYQLQPDAFQQVNGFKLGDLANDITMDDASIYVVLNGSKYVSRLDYSCVEQARFTFPQGEGEPRCIAVADGYVYVTQYGGQVSKIDAESMERLSTFNTDGNLEGIVEEGGKLYISNAYKIDGSGGYIYQKEVLVVDAETMKQTGSISVVDNPGRLHKIAGRIYLLSAGNYADVEASLQQITPSQQASTPLVRANKITQGHHGLIYAVRSDYDENWQLTNTFFTYNPATNQADETSFLPQAPASFATAAIYLLEVDEATGDIYVGTSDYVTNGTIFQFDADGALLRSFDSGGINPNAMLFIQ